MLNLFLFSKQTKIHFFQVPYIIDPSEVSLKWLREFLCQDGQQVEFVAITEESFCTVATLCVKFGFALVVTDCIAIPSILYPLIRREVFSCGGRTMIKIGDKSVDFNDRFKLIMTSRNHDQSMPPSSRGFVLPIVFNISEDGLENQILDLVVRNVLPEVEERRHLIVSEEKSLQVELISLEENLLEALSSAEGNLLENKSLIQILSETKEKSSRISDSLSESAKATREINAQSDIYRIFATYASRMFILIQSLDALNDVYRFGLDYFLDIVKCTLDDSSFIDNEVITSKIEKTCSFLLKSLVSRIGKSIFKQDKLSCVLHLVHGLNSKPWGDSWGYILGQPKPKHAASFPSWATEKEKHAFSELQAFAPAIFENNNLDSNEWKTWATEVDGAVSFPKSSRLSAIERLLLVHAVRPTDFVNTALSFCSNEIGIASLFSSDSSDVSSIYQDARRNQVHRPILYISLEENDPGAEIEEFAQSTVGIDR